MSMLKIAIRCFVRYVGIPELLVFVVADEAMSCLDTPHARSTLHRSPAERYLRNLVFVVADVVLRRTRVVHSTALRER